MSLEDQKLDVEKALSDMDQDSDTCPCIKHDDITTTFLAWTKIRFCAREPLAKFLGVMIIH